MKVILDANIVIADFRLTSPSAKTLLESSKKNDVELFIPQIVLDEVHNKFRERLEEAKAKIDKEYSVLKKLTKSDFTKNLSDSDIVNEVLGYIKYLNKIFKDYNVTVLPYPNTPHQYIVQKAIKKTKPFNASEKGYRDALIWENVKALIPEIGLNLANHSIIFITDNTKDFCSNETDLHQDLIDEFEDKYLDMKALKIFKNNQSFTDEIAKLFFEQSSSLKTKLERGEIENFDFEQVIFDTLKEELDKNDLSGIDAIPYGHLDATVRYIERFSEIFIQDVRKLNSREYLIEISCKVEMGIEFFMDKHDHYSSENTDYYVEDADWNKYVISASAEVNPELNLSVIFDSEGMLINSLQIN